MFTFNTFNTPTSFSFFSQACTFYDDDPMDVVDDMEIDNEEDNVDDDPMDVVDDMEE
jgi:hypothetical protein